MRHKVNVDVVILGAGGAGLMCAIEAGRRGRSVLVLDHSEKVGKKILISGGGRCNFTNIGANPERYQCQNRHFTKSAFSRFTPDDFIALVKKHKLPFHEKKLGQQFLDGSAQQIVDMLCTECQNAGAEIKLNQQIETVQKEEDGRFKVLTNTLDIQAQSVVVATGGLSIPKIGATNLGYKIAKQFELDIIETTPALVPFTFNHKDLELYAGLSGISFDAIVTCGKTSFRENILITHRGVSGPAILQISSYWKAGQSIRIHMLPDVDIASLLKARRKETPKQELKTVLGEIIANRFVARIFEANLLQNKPMAEMSDKSIEQVNTYFTHFTIKPNGTEGYRKAEVTLGGVNTKELDSRTLMSKKVDGLYFIGEVVDVTGWLGGYNFHWAWASGFSAGQVA